MTINLEVIAKEKNIEYFLVSWVDLFGILRAKLVPSRAINGMQKDGAGFAGFAAWLDMTPAHPDLFAIPDPDSMIQLPWKPEVAWVAADLWMDGKPVVDVVVHSANAIGSGNMMGYINNYRHLNRMEQNCVRVKIEHTV